MLQYLLMKLLRLTVILLTLATLFPAIALAQNTVSGSVMRDSSESSEERTSAAKAAFPQQLSDEQKQHIASRCKIAQERLDAIAGRLDDRGSSLLQVYSMVDRNLAAIQKRLNAHQTDTSIIDIFLISYRRQSNDLSAALENYSHALGDVVSVDCVSDPTAFKSLLENARVKRKDLSDAILMVSNTVNNDMRSSFTSLREQLRERKE